MELSTYDKILANISKTYNYAAQYGEGEIDMAAYTALIKKLFEQETLNNYSKACLIKSSQNSESVAEFNKTFNSEMSKLKITDFKTSQRYKDFMNMIQLVHTSNDNNPSTSTANESAVDLEDSSTFEEILPEFDPITKQPLQYPVRNIICKHVYEKGSVEQSLQINSRLRCPIAGCSNKQHITLTMLKEDKVLQQKLAAKRLAL